MKLPSHIIDSVERRWAAKLQGEVDEWRERKRPRQSSRLKVVQPKEASALTKFAEIDPRSAE
jgi:hypothetical protein